MKHLILIPIVAALSTTVSAMQPLVDEELQAVEAQAGADLSLKLSLNHKVNTFEFDNGPGGVCEQVQFCRLALAINKRYVNPNGNSWEASSTSGQKLWLVMKGIQGTINMQRLGIDGNQLTYTSKNKDTNNQNIVIDKAALKLSFDVNSPIQIRNFGFDALAIERDEFVSTATSTDSSTNVNDYGFLKYSVYGATANNTPAAGQPVVVVPSTPSAYDHGRETGFLGLRMNGDLAMQGRIQVFGCDSGHSRC